MTTQSTGQDDTLYQVNIELLRVQTFLFAVPRLRNMVGANVLLGEVLRRKLLDTATPLTVSGQDSLISAAADAFSEGFDTEKDPLADSEDPDDPRKLFCKGILARDGGHFNALFRDLDKAKEFKSKAEHLLRKKLPGLRFEIIVQPFGKEGAPEGEAHAPGLLDLPVFQVCQESGNGPAEGKMPPDYEVPVSLAVKTAKRKGDRFFDRERSETTQDIIGLLKHKLALLDRTSLESPKDFNELCGDDYLAVVHADGNRMGLKYKARQKGFNAQHGVKEEDEKKLSHAIRLQREGHGEQFYHRMRSAVRWAVLEALKETFGAYEGKYLPYQLLMLGGDDLLVVCQARYALDFVRCYAQNLEKFDWGKEAPLTIGAGVAIGHPNVPFHRLHALAEELASSAKRLHRGLLSQRKEELSVVDWLVFSESWAEDPIDQRRREAFLLYEANLPGQDQSQCIELALTARPYPVLKRPNGTGSLEELLDAARTLEGAARSQLRGLVDALPKGRRWAELCWRELPDDTRKKLNEAVEAATGKTKIEGPWQKAGGRWKTVIADLVELYELKRLPGEEKDKNEAEETKP